MQDLDRDGDVHVGLAELIERLVERVGERAERDPPEGAVWFCTAPFGDARIVDGGPSVERTRRIATLLDQ